ncbi:MAG TPA: hypothetical protein VMF88_03790 [Bacteroidota bacterium]|nr:hypothetical protein [Bacteroidota bacterium]
MKSVVGILLLAASATMIAQTSYPVGDDQVRSEMSSSEIRLSQANNRADFGITTGYAGFKIDDVARSGFNVDLHALVSRISSVRLEVNAGVIFYGSPYSAASRSSFYSPFIYQSNVYSASQISDPRFDLNFGVGYLGTDALYYFSNGKIRPYVAAGVEAVTWQMNQGFAATLAPSLRAGIEVAVSSSFSGFVEARYMYGFPNFLNQYSSSLNYVTDVAFGVSYAPHL